MEKKYIIHSLYRGVVATQKEENIYYSVNYLNNCIVLRDLKLIFVINLFDNILNLFEKVNLKLDNIMYMYKMGTISKRYWTKKKLLLKYNKNKYYSCYFEDKSLLDNTPTGYHKKQLVLPIKAEYEVCNYLYLKEPFIHLQEKNIVIINEIKKMSEQINNYLENYNKRLELIKIIEKLELNDVKPILKWIADYNNINNYKKTNKFLGIFKGNFTTDINKNSIVLVEQKKIQEKPLNKGLAFHNKNYFLGKIESDKDFMQIFTYIIINFDDDLKQKILIERNSKIEALDELYNSQARKILNQIGIKEIIINNKIKTKKQLLQYLYDNWLEIREK